jgi:hypothetical protein
MLNMLIESIMLEQLGLRTQAFIQVEFNLGQPVASDVRYNTLFGVSNEYTGSLRVS